MATSKSTSTGKGTAKTGGGSRLETCSRGHHYRGNRCPICWPGGASKETRAGARGGGKAKSKTRN